VTEDAAAARVAWRRAAVDGAGIWIDQHPEWPLLDGEGLVYQRFSNEGAVSVRWGPEATIDQVLAHVGLGSGGLTRTVETDQAATVDGVPARRVRLRVRGPAAHATGMPPLPPGGPERVYVFVGFRVSGTPVLTGYRAPASELAAVAPLLEHILASVQVRSAGSGTERRRPGPGGTAA
jgi:hypothetical protein